MVFAVAWRASIDAYPERKIITMFLKATGGYDRAGQQYSRGSFLLVFSHNSRKWEEQNNKPRTDLHGQSFDVLQGDGFTVQKTCTCCGLGTHPYPPEMAADVPAHYMEYCPVHSSEYKTMPKELNRKLYACLRHVSLRQLGHFMMGVARIGGQSVTVSGAYGSDGLPMDYEALSLSARAHLTELPTELTETFWQGGGHNTCGNEADAMRQWAKENLRKAK